MEKITSEEMGENGLKALRTVFTFGGQRFIDNYDGVVLMGAKTITINREPMIVLKSMYKTDEIALRIYCKNGGIYAIVNKALCNPEILSDQIAIREDSSEIIKSLLEFNIIKDMNKLVPYGYYLKAKIFEVII